MKNVFQRHPTAFLFSALLIIIYFPLFLQIDRLPFHVWDESITGVNAYKMMDNHQYFVTHFLGGPDMSNTKPPLLIWCIVAVSKVIGFCELSVRLPSALAGLALCIYLFFALRRFTGSPVLGFLAVMVLITTHGYIRTHVTRTGEYDSLLVLFSTLFGLHLFFAYETENTAEQRRYLFLFFVFLTLAVLTKGIACLMQAPGLFLYTLLRRKLKMVLTNQGFYLGLLFFLVFGLGFYFLRESLNPGYINAVWMNELGGRFAETNEGHKAPFSFYFYEILNSQFAWYNVLLVPGAAAMLVAGEKKLSRLVGFSALIAFCFGLVVSSSQTKLPYYIAPLYPHFAIVVGSFLYFFYSIIKEKLQLAGYTATRAVAIPLACVSLTFVLPYISIYDTISPPKNEPWEESFSRSCTYFQKAVRNQVDASGQKFVFDFDGEFAWHRPIVRCYQRELKEKKIAAVFLETDQVQVGDTVLLFEGQTYAKLNQQFNLTYLNHIETGNADRWFIQGQKALTANL